MGRQTQPRNFSIAGSGGAITRLWMWLVLFQIACLAILFLLHNDNPEALRFLLPRQFATLVFTTAGVLWAVRPMESIEVKKVIFAAIIAGMLISTLSAFPQWWFEGRICPSPTGVFWQSGDAFALVMVLLFLAILASYFESLADRYEYAPQQRNLFLNCLTWLFLGLILFCLILVQIKWDSDLISAAGRCRYLFESDIARGQFEPNLGHLPQEGTLHRLQNLFRPLLSFAHPIIAFSIGAAVAGKARHDRLPHNDHHYDEWDH